MLDDTETRIKVLRKYLDEIKKGRMPLGDEATLVMMILKKYGPDMEGCPDRNYGRYVWDYLYFDIDSPREFWGDPQNWVHSGNNEDGRERRRKIHWCVTQGLLAELEKVESPSKEAPVALGDNELQVLFDMAEHESELRIRATIAAATDIPDSTVKGILREFEDQGWVYRPEGPRKGYVITPKGLRQYSLHNPE